jgi:predicted nucleic acid-binding protein
MNGSNFVFVIDTNVIFMALYNSWSKAGKVIQLALENKIKIYSSDNIKEEIIRILKKELNYSENELNLTLDSLPIEWVCKDVYFQFLGKTEVKHKPDKPLEALAIALNVRILSADKHFRGNKRKMDVNELLKSFEM